MPFDAHAAPSTGTLDLHRARPGKRAVARDMLRWAAEAMADLAVAEVAQASQGWTPEIVGDQLLEAMRWVRRTGPAGPRGMSSLRLNFIASMDDHLAEGWGLPEVADDDLEERELILPPSAKQVSRHMAALQWPADYLLPGHVGSARMVGLWAVCKVSRRSFAGAVKARGVARLISFGIAASPLSVKGWPGTWCRSISEMRSADVNKIQSCR